MSAIAIFMMIFAMLVIWGGLAFAIWNLNRFQGEEPTRIQRDL